MSLLSRESLLLRQNLMYKSSVAAELAETYHHLLINFVPANGRVTFDGSTSLNSTTTVNLVEDNRIRFSAITGSVPTELGTDTLFVTGLVGTGTFTVATASGGTPIAVPSSTSTIEYTERDPNGQDPLAVWVKHEVATSTGYARCPFTLTESVVGTDNKVGPATLLATHAAPDAEIIYNRIVTAFNATAVRGNTTGGVDTYSVTGTIQIPVGETFEFPIDLKTAMVDPDTVALQV